MEHQNLESEDAEKTKKIAEEIENISLYVLSEDVTDDNPSPSNGLTGLEQLILFELGDYISRELTLDDIKEKILLEVDGLEEECDGEEFDEMVYGEFISEEEDEEVNLDTPEMEKLIKKIAKNCIANNITDDNPSPLNKATGWEQIIYYEFGDMPSYYEINCALIIRMIKKVKLDLEGGSNLAAFYKNKDYIDNNFV